MKNIVSLSLVLFIGLSACENRAGNQVTPPPSSVTAQPQSNPVPSNAQPVSQPQQNGSVALNPKHGQPGHRCDIPEGAPLNSPATSQPAFPQQPAITQQPTLTSPLISQPAGNTSGGNVRLNPAHGQPGHDCAVQVGQPLRN